MKITFQSNAQKNIKKKRVAYPQRVWLVTVRTTTCSIPMIALPIPSIKTESRAREPIVWDVSGRYTKVGLKKMRDAKKNIKNDCIAVRMCGGCCYRMRGGAAESAINPIA